jgi:hypothetical protein
MKKRLANKPLAKKRSERAPRRFTRTTTSAPSRLEAELAMNVTRLKALVSAQMLWDRVLTEAERRELGGDCVSAWQKYGTVEMYARLHGVTSRRAVADAARALNFIDEVTYQWMVRELGEMPEENQEAIRRAAAVVPLVVVDSRDPEVYWEGKRVDVAWDADSVLWVYFVLLAGRAQAGLGLDQTDFPNANDPEIVSKRKNRLTKDCRFPAGLGERIVTARNGQRLNLQPSQIRIFKGIKTIMFRKVRP